MASSSVSRTRLVAELLSQASLCGGRGPRGGLAGPGRPPRPGADVFLRVRLEFWGLRRLYNTFLRCGKLGSTKQKQNVKYVKQITTKFTLVLPMNTWLLM